MNNVAKLEHELGIEPYEHGFDCIVCNPVQKAKIPGEDRRPQYTEEYIMEFDRRIGEYVTVKYTTQWVPHVTREIPDQTNFRYAMVHG